VILLDTHALIWMDIGSASLGPSARKLILSASVEGDLFVSAISFWESAMLYDRQRLKLPRPPVHWREDILSAGVREAPVDGAIAVAAAQLSLDHKDPADRLIVATALAYDATLLTADKSILRWRGKLRRQDASK